MIISTDYLREVKQVYQPSFFNLQFSKTIASWCFEYFKRYNAAPNKQIQEIYHNKLKLDLDTTEAELIADFLSGLSEEYEEAETFNNQYLLDRTIEHFRLQSLKQLSANLKQAITTEQIEDAEAFIKGYQRVSRPEVEGIDPFTEEAVKLVWEQSKGDRLFRFPGDLGFKLGYFEREQLVALMGEQNVGKSFWLQFFAQQAVRAGLNVLFVSFELSKRQVINRILHNITAMPKESGEIFIPVFDCIRNQEDTCNREKRVNQVKLIDDKGKLPDREKTPKGYRACTECRDSKSYEKTVWYKTERRRKRTQSADSKQIKTERNLLRGKKLVVMRFPSKTIKVSDLKPILYNLEHYKDFIPDVIVIDFADKMLPEYSDVPFRLQIGNIWVMLKSMAQERHCLVVTASQSNTLRTGKKINQGSWAEDISKQGEIDIGFAIYQTPDQKLLGIMEVIELKKRDDEYNILSEITILENRKIGRIYLDSHYDR
jgi:hypothetical protein